MLIEDCTEPATFSTCSCPVWTDACGLCPVLGVCVGTQQLRPVLGVCVGTQQLMAVCIVFALLGMGMAL